MNIEVGATGVIHRKGRGKGPKSGRVIELAPHSLCVEWTSKGKPVTAWFAMPAMADGSFKLHGVPLDQAMRFVPDSTVETPA